MSDEKAYAYVTMLVSHEFLPGTIGLIKSLKLSKSTYPIVVMHTKNLPAESLASLKEYGAQCQEIPGFALIDKQLVEIGVPEEMTDICFTKLNLWSLIQFQKIIYIDSDAIVLKNVDHLFEKGPFAAAPCQSCPDKFGAGVLIASPDLDVFRQMKVAVGRFLMTDPGVKILGYTLADQGFLNLFYNEWFYSDTSARLSSGYNCYREILLQYPYDNWNGKGPHIIHYNKPIKPWDLKSGQKDWGGVNQPLNKLWLDIYESKI
jgi:glycogenin